MHELTPGTKLSQEIHTVTTPQEVTTLRTLNGRVWHVNAPHLIVSLPEGENREYTVPDELCSTSMARTRRYSICGKE